jgi:O-antigen ligase
MRERVIANWLMYVGVTIQLLFVLLLSSRMQILIMIMLILGYFIIRYYKMKKLYLGVTYIVLIFSFGYLFMSQPSALNYRYNQSISQINSIGIDNDNSDPRKFIWAEGLKVIKNNWLIGAGAGDAKDVLVARYSRLILDNPTADNLVDSTVFQIKKNNKTVAYLKEMAISSDNTYKEQLSMHAKNRLKRKNNHYNASFQRAYNFHNQYLQTFGEIGIFGFLLLFFLLASPFILSIRNKDYLAMSFLIIVGASFLTESMLERQAGVAFISFFYTLLIILKPNISINPLNSPI